MLDLGSSSRSISVLSGALLTWSLEPSSRFYVRCQWERELWVS